MAVGVVGGSCSRRISTFPGYPNPSYRKFGEKLYNCITPVLKFLSRCRRCWDTRSLFSGKPFKTRLTQGGNRYFILNLFFLSFLFPFFYFFLSLYRRNNDKLFLARYRAKGLDGLQEENRYIHIYIDIRATTSHCRDVRMDRHLLQFVLNLPLIRIEWRDTLFYPVHRSFYPK